jgi:hypothetical protein
MQLLGRTLQVSYVAVNNMIRNIRTEAVVTNSKIMCVHVRWETRKQKGADDCPERET